MNETILFKRIPLVRVFLFAIAVAVMGHRTKGHCASVRSGLCRSSHAKGFLKKMLWEISQNSQDDICAGISFLVFSCEFCETCNISFFAEQHWTTAFEYRSINSSEGSTVLVNETVNYDTKTKAYVLTCARSVSD